MQDVRDELQEGEQVMVKVISIDPSGKIRLSRKALLAPEEGGGGRVRSAPRERAAVFPILACRNRPAPVTIRQRLSPSAARLKDWRARMAPQVLARRSLAPLLLGLLGLFCAGDAGLAQDTPQRPLAITITAHKYEFSQARIDVTQDDVIRITLVAEDIPHSFIVDEYRVAKRAAPGKPITFEFRADKAGTFPFYCNLTIDDGCRTMRGELVVAPRPR